MSFLTRSAIRQSAAAHSVFVSPPVARLWTTPIRNKTVTESTKDTLDTVNKKVGKGLASAIEGTEKVFKKTKEAVGGKTDEAAKQVKETASEASQKVNQTATEAGQKKDELLKKGKSD